MNDPPTRQRTRAGFAWAGVALLALISLRFLRPTIRSNEAVYLLRGRRIIEPTFLANDWAVGAEAWYQSMSVAFDVLAGALWASLGDAIPVVLVGRLFAWTLAVASLARLASTAGVHPGFFLAGAAAWLIGGQAFSAGESIFGAVEQKVFAYAALFAALDAACRGRVLRAGVFAGVAIAFHVLVGGWGGAALGIGVLVRYRSLREGLRFGLPALLLGAPVMFIAMSSLVAASPEAAPDPEAVDRLLVLFRNPHHLDPARFLGAQRAVVFVGMLVSSAWAVSRVASRDAARILIPFLVGVAAVHLVGVAARPLNALWLLRFYPFRVADAMVPLVFWLALPQALYSQARSLRSAGLAVRTLAPIVLFAAMLAQVGFEAQRELRGRFSRGTAFTVSAWRQTPRDPFREASEWIRDHTPADSIIATSPCRASFRLEAERSVVVGFKMAPANARILEWYERLTAMNRDLPFEELGLDACRELDRNYRALTPAQLRRLRSSYGADFYLVEAERPDLARALRYSNGALSLYDLEAIDSG